MGVSSYTAAIIGCGRIGTHFDTPESDMVLTHAKAYSLHPKIRMAAVMDIEISRATEAGKIWDCDIFDNLSALFHKWKPDIVSICVPDQFHYQYLNRCLEYQPKAVVAEKPLTLNTTSSKEIVSLYKEHNIPLFVNYSRRYDPVMQAVRKRIVNNEMGQILHASFKYTKGILHNGSHAVDAANFLFGNYIGGQPLHAITDYSENDPTLSAMLQYSKCHAVFLMACDERSYSIFEIDIVGEKGRVVFDHFGLQCREYRIRKDPVFDGYKDIEEDQRVHTGLSNSIRNLIENVTDHLDYDTPILCSGEDAIASQEICQSLIEQYHKGLK